MSIHRYLIWLPSTRNPITWIFCNLFKHFHTIGHLYCAQFFMIPTEFLLFRVIYWNVCESTYVSFTFIYVCHLLWNLESLAAQSCPTLCNPMDCNPPGSCVHEILQARILESVAIPFSRGSSWPRDQTQIPYIAGRLLTVWATREALGTLGDSINWNFKDWPTFIILDFYVARICEWFSAKWGFAHNGAGFPPSICPISLTCLVT